VKDAVLLHFDQNGASEMKPMEVVRAVEVQLDAAVGLRPIKIDIAEVEFQMGSPDSHVPVFQPRPGGADLVRLLDESRRVDRQCRCRNRQREHGESVGWR